MRLALPAIDQGAQVVVKTDGREDGGDEDRQQRIAILRHRRDQRNSDRDAEDQEAAEGRSAGLAQMAFRPVGADRLAELALAEIGDERISEGGRDDAGRDAP